MDLIIINNANGLYYNWNRWYNPDVGRYDGKTGINLNLFSIIYFDKNYSIFLKYWQIYEDFYNYKYVMNNPVLYIDKNGLGVSGPWGQLPWFLEPPYCPFYQIFTWVHCWMECKKEKKPCEYIENESCTINCVYEYYKRWPNPMYPLPFISNW